MSCWGKEYNFIWRTHWPRWWQWVQNNYLVGAWLVGSFRDQTEIGGRWGNKKTIQLLQISPRMSNFRQGDVLVSPPYSHFTGGMKWNIWHIKKQGYHSYMWFCPQPHHKCEFLSHASKQQSGTIPYTRNLRMSQAFKGGQGQVISQWAKQRHFNLRVGQRRGRVPRGKKKRIKVTETDSVWSQN